jgi:hypothetical protein
VADNPDLSVVATDGSACLWVSTSTGRQFARITAVNNTTKVVTVDAYGVTATGQNWAIGGKRETLDAASSRTLFSTTGWRPGWECLLEDNQTITSTLSLNGPNLGGYVVLRSSVAGTSRTITCSANTTAIDWVIGGFSEIHLTDLAIENTAGTKTSSNGISSSGSGSNRFLTLTRCAIGHPTNQLNIGMTTGSCRLIDSSIRNCVGYAADVTSPFCAYGSVIHSNGNALRINSGVLNLIRCLVYGNTNENILVNPSSPNNLVADCTFDSAGTDVFSTSFGSGGHTIQFINCNFTKGGGFGIRSDQISELPEVIATNCNYGSGVDANTSGAFTPAGSVLERNCIAVTPSYVNRATANYGPGSAIAGQGLPKSPATLGNGIAVATSIVDIGAFQSAGGGGGLILPRPMNGGYSA